MAGRSFVLRSARTGRHFSGSVRRIRAMKTAKRNGNEAERTTNGRLKPKAGARYSKGERGKYVILKALSFFFGITYNLPMPRAAAQKTHRTVSNSLTRVVTRRERVVVHRRGKAVAALIPLEDLALLEELEDQKDVEEYRAAKAEWEREGRKTTSLDDVVKELGIRA